VDLLNLISIVRPSVSQQDIYLIGRLIDWFQLDVNCRGGRPLLLIAALSIPFT
jgi:hypothetical protein